MYRKSVVLLALIGILAACGAADAQLVVKINFQLASAEVPAGYLPDSGLAFGDRGNGYSYGWSRDISADSRDRANANPDQRYDTLLHLQKGAAAIWEIVLPNGEYNLYWVSGDPTATDQTNSFNVEGVQVPDPDGQDNFDEFTVTVKVLDGRLTLQPGTGAANSKICFIDITQIVAPTKALEPVPAKDAKDVARDVTLSWTAPVGAATHQVFLGAGLDEVANATAGEEVTDAAYPTAGLVYGQTYYWRVDEVNAADGEVTKGDIWSFTVEPFSYPITKITATASSSQADMGPEKTIGGLGLNANDEHSVDAKTMWLSGDASPVWIQYAFDKAYKLDQLWVWNSNQLVESFVGFGVKDVKVEYSVDGSTWTELAGVPEFAQATGSATDTHNTTVEFGGVMARYVKLTINSTWGGVGKGGLSEVRFFYVPVQAFLPAPADAATGVELDASLNWRPGREAGSHKLYFGKDKDAVAGAAAAAQTLADHSFAPATMDLDATYYWRVDEVNDAMAPSVHEGAVWSFTTRPYTVVEDFESYTDEEGSRIYETWIDGMTDGKSGSVVGHLEAPFAETTTVHGDKQAMPMTYDNTKLPTSEATLAFGSAQNWTASGIKSLSLYFQGAAGNGGTLYVKINGAKVAYNGDAADITRPAWIPWNIDLSAVSGNLSKVTSLAIGVEGSGAQGMLYIDDIRLYPKTPEFVTPVQPDAANLLALYAFEGNANDTSGHKLNGTIKDGQLVASGRTNGGSAVQINKLGYVDLGNPPLLDMGTADWTLAAWYKTNMTGTGDANKGTIVGKGGDSTGGQRYALIMSETAEGVVSLITDDDVTKYVVDAKSKTNDDEWHFVAGQREGAALRIYIDGQLEGAGAATAVYSLAGTSQHNAYIGAMTNHSTSPASLYKLFSGMIDEVRIYNKALSEAELLWLTGKTSPVARPF